MNKKEIVELLQSKGKEQKALFKQAREVRKNIFGNIAFLRAIIEPSNNCRNRCLYCAMREGSEIVERYRMNPNEIERTADEMAEHGVNTFSIETGEDPKIIDTLVKTIPRLKKKDYSLLGIIGNHEKNDFKRLKDAGLNSYLLKFETSDPNLFETLRPGTTLKRRLEDLEYLRGLDCTVGTGNIVGLPGQTIENIADDILLARQINPEMVSAAPFIPSPGTPLENEPYGNINLTLNTLAIYRILLPNTQIPALCALNHYPNVGQIGGLNAGANDVLINTATPESLSSNFAIYSKKKLYVSLEEGLKVLKKAGLKFDPLERGPLYRK